MLDWSYSLLSDREKLVLCRLSVFVGAFTLQAVGFIASETEADEADVIDTVTRLVAKSLVSTTVINESTYYRLLDTTRAYAAAKLAGRGEAARIARRHAILGFSNTTKLSSHCSGNMIFPDTPRAGGARMGAVRQRRCRGRHRTRHLGRAAVHRTVAARGMQGLV
jgi:hypothetical protein